MCAVYGPSLAWHTQTVSNSKTDLQRHSLTILFESSFAILVGNLYALNCQMEEIF